MSTNSRGSYRTTRENVMRAFDALTPAARKALREAAFNWVPQQIRTRYRKGYDTDETIGTFIAWWDAEKVARDRAKVWGIADEVQPKPKRRRP
jgi:Family of unknown function (DUF6525)